MSETYCGMMPDDAGELGFGAVEIGYEFEFVVTPPVKAKPGHWPFEAATVDIENLWIMGVTPTDGTALSEPLTHRRLEQIAAWVDERIGVDWESIEQEILAEVVDDN